MRSIYLILAQVWAASGVPFKVIEKYTYDWETTVYYKCHGRVGNETILACVYQKEETYLFLAENIKGFNKESQMPAAAVLQKHRGYRSYDRLKNLKYLATKEGRNMNFDTLNGDDHDYRQQFYMIRA